MKARAESLTLPVLTILALVAMMAFLPGRYRVMPASTWGPAAIGLAFIVPMIAAAWVPPTTLWRRIERAVILILVILINATDIITLRQLIVDMIAHNRNISPVMLLSTAVAIWVANVIAFAFTYWLLDRGGPYGRSGGWNGRADLTFPRGDPSDGMPADWQPSFGDYLFLSFNTATAFSPTDTLPLTLRMKMLIMGQSAISLVTVIIVAARAINILGT